MRCPTYLTRRGDAWTFQIRLPRALAANSSLANIRASFGVIPQRRALRMAGILAAAARLAFAREAGATTMTTEAPAERRDRLEREPKHRLSDPRTRRSVAPSWRRIARWPRSRE
jgi:hypothetical protein